MKKILTSFFSIFILNITGQIVVVDGYFEKQEYKLDETIKFVIDVNAVIDSVKRHDTTDFYSRKSQSISTNSSFKDNKFTYRSKYIYTLFPKKTGVLSLGQLSVFIKGKVYTIQDKKIVIQDIKETTNDKRNEKIKDWYKELNLMPNFSFNQSKIKENTMRIVVSGNLGFIEIFTNDSWGFYKTLSEDEIILLNTLKK